MQPTTMPRLGTELDKESYIWLAANHSDILEAVEFEVAAGHSPEEIRMFVLRETCRPDVAKRCQLAARHIEATFEKRK